jgi:Cu+-exporting ATPase
MKETAAPPTIKCIHCGDDCGRYPVVWEEKNFCCQGCLTVYQLLNQNKLNQYYKIVDTPGIRTDSHDYGNKYAFLDNEDIKTQIVDFSQGEISKVTLFIPSIHCSSCIWLLENLHMMDAGIKNSLVHFTKKEVSITFNHEQISLRRLVELLASVHYIPQINLQKTQAEGKRASNTRLIAKIGVAGFAFGNIMLFSMPEYLSFRNDLDTNFQNFFGWVNVLLSLPVLLFSGSDYLISAWKNLRRGIVNIDLPVGIGMVALASQSYFEIFTGTGTGYLDSLAGFVFFLLIGKWYQNQTYQSLAFDRDYTSYFPVAVTLLEDGDEKSVALHRVKPGDRLLIRNHELIPADGQIVKGQGNIDYSFVTGESLPVARNEGDDVFAGGRQIGSALEMVVHKEVSQSQLTQLWNENTSTEKSTSRIRSLIDQLSRNFTVAVLIIALLTAIYWYIVDPSIALMAFTSVLIVACPCAIALSMPFSFGAAMRFFGFHGFYLKNTDVVERLSHVDTVVFDKTGTITSNDHHEVTVLTDTLSEAERIAVRSLARQSAHPLSKALFEWLQCESNANVVDYMEIPSSGIKGVVDGMAIRLGSAAFVLQQQEEAEVFASQIYISINGKFKARYAVRNSYRKGMEQIVSALGRDKELHLISGDNDAEHHYLTKIFGSENRLHFNMSPQQKLEYIAKLKVSRRHVLMIGDGLNDAGALYTSDVGISIADDIYQFSPACDAILEAARFDQLEQFIRFTRTSLNIVKTSYGISILYNLVGLAFAVQGLLSPIIAAILMPLSSITVVAFVTFTTRWAARMRFKN